MSFQFGKIYTYVFFLSTFFSVAMAEPVSTLKKQQAESSAENSPSLHYLELNATEAKRVGQFSVVNAYKSRLEQSLKSNGKDTSTLQFKSVTTRAGYYRVFAWWPISASTGELQFKISAATKQNIISASPLNTGGEWRYLSLLSLPKGRVSVDVSAKGEFYLDAIRLEYVGDTRPPLKFAQNRAPIIQVQETQALSLRLIDSIGVTSYKVVNGRLPDGLFMNEHSGKISGRAFRTGVFTADIEAKDAAAGRVRQSFEFHVEDATPVNDSPELHQSQLLGKSLNLIAKQSPEVSASADVSALLATISDLPEGAWLRANTNNFSDVWAPVELRPLDNGGNPTPSKIIGAWSSFDWDSKRADLIIYGGGHANYSGNDVYRWRASSRQWERMSLPSEVKQDSSRNYVAIDGALNAPASAHTYDNNIYLAVADKFLSFGGAAYNNGDMYFFVDSANQNRRTGPYLFDPAKANPMSVGGSTGSHVKRVAPFPEILGGQMWQNRDLYKSIAQTPQLPKRHTEGCTAYAEEMGKDVVYVGANHSTGTALNLYRYVINDVNNPSTDEWKIVGRWWNGAQAQTSCAYDPERKLFVRVSGSTKPFAFWNLNNAGPNNDDVVIIPTDLDGAFTAKYSTGAISPKHCGFDFDPMRKQFVMWCGGENVYLLKAPTPIAALGWTIQKGALVATSVPSTIYGTGILGKWKYIPNLDVFIGLQDSNAGNIWIYKPEGWQQPSGGGNLKPVVSLSSPINGAEFVSGNLIYLAADATDLDGQVAKVEFYDGATLIGTDLDAPYQWDWSSAAVGSHTITALATDNVGAQTWSSGVNIQVLPGASGTVTLQQGMAGYTGAQDTYLSTYSKSGIAGAQSVMYDENNSYSPMVRFNVFASEGGVIPEGAVIQQAKLYLYKANSYEATWGAHRLLRDWRESQASWNHFQTNQAWAVGGANGIGVDYVGTADSTSASGWGSGWVVFDVTSSLQMMQSNGANYGWRIIRSAGDRYNLKRFNSKEFMTDVSQRPKLVITYSAP